MRRCTVLYKEATANTVRGGGGDLFQHFSCYMCNTLVEKDEGENSVRIICTRITLP